MAFRTQKISQMTPKGSDLEATDLIEVSTIESGSYVTRSITGQELIDAIPLPPSGITIGTTAITSGTVGRVLFEGTGNVVQQSANLFWDNTNGRLGIGTSSPAFRLEVQGGDVRFANGLTIGTAGSTGWQFSSNTLTIIQNGFLGVDVANGREFSITNTAFSTTYFKIAATTGNVLINTTTDAGFRLDVNGTARVTSSLRVESSFTALSSATIGGTTLAANAILQVNGSGKYVNYNSSFSSGSFLTYQAFGTWEAIGADSPAGTILAFGGYRASQWTGITFHSNGSERMRIDASGNVGIGTSTPSTPLHVAGNITIGGASATTVSSTYNSTTRNQNRYTNGSSFEFHEGVNERMRIAAGGNVLINTATDAGYKLDVNGTANIGTSTNNVKFTNSAAANFIQHSTSATYFGYLFPATNAYGVTASRETYVLQAGGSIKGFRFETGTGQATMFVNTTGGTSSDQYVNIGGNRNSQNSPSSILELESTVKGFLPPRMTNAQRAAIASPAVGLIVYCTDSTEGLYVYKSTGWTFMV